MNKVQRALRKRYSNIHPLMFERACEKSQTDGELFDMLETMPPDYPIIWDDDKREWVKADLLQYDELELRDKND